ncbi:MAG: RdgB/HAM1 family non-canonical purine NTP pyrophosphatase [Elusimicrobiota bacterium]|jgi:XTP/dITP diphosphohydrolase|nr:RdgB/HAM1 family non-canonical purine NTP pyrophosphatase [Elusimicrobiota bacterium]
MEILLATGNKHKAFELLKILPLKTNSGKSIKYLTLADFPSTPEPEENGKTLADNAIIKATFGLKLAKIPTLADDTGLIVDALGGQPGVHSARYAFKDKADYAANNEKLLKELATTPANQRTARFTTVAALALPNGEIILKEGSVEGTIAQNYLGEKGFGYDPLFLVKDANKTMAQMTAEEKNKISHRAKAFLQMAEKIKKLN